MEREAREGGAFAVEGRSRMRQMRSGGTCQAGNEIRTKTGPVRVEWVLCRLDTPIRRLLEVGLGVAGQVRGRKRARKRGGPLEIHGMRVGRQRGGKAREPIHATVKQGVRDKGALLIPGGV